MNADIASLLNIIIKEHASRFNHKKHLRKTENILIVMQLALLALMNKLHLVSLVIHHNINYSQVFVNVATQIKD